MGVAGVEADLRKLLFQISFITFFRADALTIEVRTRAGGGAGAFARGSSFRDLWYFCNLIRANEIQGRRKVAKTGGAAIY